MMMNLAWLFLKILNFMRSCELNASDAETKMIMSLAVRPVRTPPRTPSWRLGHTLGPQPQLPHQAEGGFELSKDLVGGATYRMIDLQSSRGQSSLLASVTN